MKDSTLIYHDIESYYNTTSMILMALGKRCNSIANALGLHLIKSPRYTRGDFMFLYRFVRRHRRRRRPQILVHAITFEQLFGFRLFLARLLALTCRLPD